MEKILKNKWGNYKRLKTVTKICKVCGKKFHPTRNEYNTCSNKCGCKLRKGITSYKKKKIRCDYCGTIIFRTPYEINYYKHHYCSKKCDSKHKLLLEKGGNNPNWKGGISFKSNEGGISSISKSYSKGKYYERKTRNELEKSGFYTIRSAASKGLIDIVGISKEEIKLIQVKSGTSIYRKVDRIKFEKLSVPFVCNKELWKWKEGKREPFIENIKNYEK